MNNDFFFTLSLKKISPPPPTVGPPPKRPRTTPRRSLASHPTWGEHYAARNPLAAHEVALHSNKKYWFDCPKCPHPFEARAYHIAQGTGCPTCKHKTELKVASFLLTLQVTFKKEWSPRWCATEYLTMDKKGVVHHQAPPGINGGEEAPSNDRYK